VTKQVLIYGLYQKNVAAAGTKFIKETTHPFTASQFDSITIVLQLLLQHLFIVSMSVTLIIGREKSHNNPY